ncbi:probable G-protein coupled receptor 21 [Haliotis rufescens]|uniref:probable G-protein coupled receptor 21 n=1 Tax=Haliotis rufescens TaxID=6454 RepID=UPI00201EFD63|nr:probable G-protein coupled receptor 21 [Haliotis rufescens]
MHEQEGINQTDNITDVAKGDNVILGVIYLLVSVAVMTTNGAIVLVIGLSKQLHMPTLWLITYRAVCDFCLGVYCLTFVVPSAFLNHFAYSEHLIGVASSIATLLTGQTIFNIALAVIDRYIAISRPLAYTRLVTTKVFFLAIGTTVLLSVGRFLMIVFPDMDFYYNSNLHMCLVDFDTTSTVVASVGIPLLTLAIIVICSCMISAELKCGKRRVHSVGTDVQENTAKFPLMVTLAAGVFCLSYVPFIVSVTWSLVSSRGQVPRVLSKVSSVSLLSSSLWNVIIYTVTYRPFRDHLMRLFCKVYVRRQRRAEIHREARFRNRNEIY